MLLIKSPVVIQYHHCCFSLCAVRDYVLAKMEEERELTGGLQLLQRCFVAEFLDSQNVWEDTKGTTIHRGKEFDWYFASGALRWHMQNAWMSPLAEDDQACSWLQNTNMRVVQCAVNAIPVELQVSLAEELSKAGQQERAVQTLHNVITMRQLPLGTRQEYAKILFSYIDRVPAEERSSDCSKCDANVAWMMQLDSITGSSEWDLGLERLMGLIDSGASIGHNAA